MSTSSHEMNMDLGGEPERDFLRNIFSNIASVLGIILILLGLWALGSAVYHAWLLFSDPASITYFAEYVIESAKIVAHLPEGGNGAAHLVSWFVVILMLLVLGKLGDWAISAGSRLLFARQAS
jgi:hypothetical protein